MTSKIWASAAALGLVAAGIAVIPAAAAAATAVPPIVTIAVVGDQATISQSTIRPGIVEFHVGKTFTIPGDEGGPDTLSIVRTDALDQVLALLPAVFQGDRGNPAALAAAAESIRAIHALATWYGGANTVGIWQVKLPAGNYYALGVQSTAIGMAKPVQFTVAGAPRPGSVRESQLGVKAVGTVGKNTWVVMQSSTQPIEWVRFTNAARELHFLDLVAVKSITTNTMVKRSFQGPPGSPPKWFTGPDYRFDVISPGVTVSIKEAVKPGRHLVQCFMPSEADGMPHALMGMWKLLNVK
jgi:hypothetical protein